MIVNDKLQELGQKVADVSDALSAFAVQYKDCLDSTEQGELTNAANHLDDCQDGIQHARFSHASRIGGK